LSILVVDIGTSGVRAAVVRPDGSVEHVHHHRLPPVSPFPGLVEFDAAAMAAAALEVANAALSAGGPVDAVGIANQRTSTILWDRATGEPVGPGLGWQDLRTVGECLVLGAEHGLRVMPNQSATKAAWLLDQHDADRARDLCLGTVDSWIAWTLSNGALHVTDRTNAALTGFYDHDGPGSWDERALGILRIPRAALPQLVDTSGTIGPASALPGAPPLCAIAGDQQASLVGQACVTPGPAKITCGTGAMLDVCTGAERPLSAARSENGTFPLVAWTIGGDITWGAEGIMLSAGANVDWLCADLGIIDAPADSDTVASQCDDTDGVVYVPAPLGLGTPYWDYGARGTLLGLTRGTGRPQIVRAVLEGVAQRAADLVEAAEADTGRPIDVLRVDGGMSANPTFVQAIADATQRPVEVSPVLEATTLGAAYLAGVAAGTWATLDDAAASWSPARRVEPERVLDRARWADAVARARSWIPDLSSIDF
jgi:glycerol kinase